MTIRLIVEFALVVGLVIFVHEFGHFVAMKLAKIDVEEFGFGYPPRMVRLFNFGETKITLNWIPFGGFVRMKSENDPTVPGSFAAANPWTRIGVMLAGPIMNLVLAVVLFIAIYGIIGILPDRNRVQLVQISPDSPASTAGLKAGDILVNVGGVDIHSLDSVKTIIYGNLGKPIDFTYERDSKIQKVSITPLANPGESGAVGIYMSYPMKPYTLWGAIPESFQTIYEYGRDLVTMLGRIVRGQSTTPEGRLIGLKGMFDIYASMRETPGTTQVPQIVNTLAFVSSINISLALLNLIPFPALDGGRIAFALPEIILRRRIPPKYEMAVISISFVLLILLMIYINLQDFIHPISTPIP